VPEHTDKGRVLLLDAHVREALRRGALHQAEPLLRDLRFASYRSASLTWEDGWWLARVAGVEELQAEAARQRADWATAWGSWRSGWWVRQLLARQGARPQLRRAAWSTAVMGALHLAVGRVEDGRRRVGEALDAWEELGLDPKLRHELAAGLAALEPY
jgi:hypothetical protein